MTGKGSLVLLSLLGATVMQHWKAKHSERILAGGALRGLRFSELSQEQLVRAARRYPGDSKLQKYAKAVTASAELDGNEAEPEPCLPLAIRKPSSSDIVRGGFLGTSSVLSWLFHLRWRRVVLFAVFSMLLMFIFKPGLATACAKVLVRFMRLALRRITGFLMLLLEGLLDEIIYQIEFTIRQAIPSNMDFEQIAQAPLNLVSHIISALTGAGFSILVNYMQARRGQIPAAAA